MTDNEINIMQEENTDINILNIPSRGIQPFLNKSDVLKRVWKPYNNFIENFVIKGSLRCMSNQPRPMYTQCCDAPLH